MLNTRVVFLVLSVLVLVGCDSKKQEDAPKNNTEEKVQDKIGEVTFDENVFAVVNGEQITLLDLEYAVDKFFGDQFVDHRAILKIQDSLISQKALSQIAKKELEQSLLDEIEVATQAYKEERLIAAYIQNTQSPKPVSIEQVKAYYDANLEEFGQTIVKSIYIAKAQKSNSGLSAGKIAQELMKFVSEENWETSSNKPEYITVIKSTSNSQLPKGFLNVINSTAVGEQTSLIVKDDDAYIIKVLSQKTIPAVPLSQVSQKIRRKLAAENLKQIVKELTDSAVSNSDVIKNY